MNPAVARTVIDRSEGHCETRGTPLLDGEGQLHHRLLRSRGGKDDIANLIRICPPCHQEIHGNPALAMANGWTVGSWETLSKPFNRHGVWVRLENDGSITHLAENPVLF